MNVETANRLVELRKNSGLSQEILADRLGVSRQAVSKWERAESSPDTDNLIALSELYEISIDELLNRDAGSYRTNEEKAKEDKLLEKQVAWAAIGAMVAVITFFLTGFLLGAWAYNWVFYLIIPIFYYIPVITDK